MRPALVVLLACVALAGCGGEDERGPTPGRGDLDRRLIEAAYDNDVAAARRLIADGADVNAKDVTQQSAYLIATSEVGDDPRLLELTLANGARVDDKDSYNGTGLIRAAERGFPRIVRRLLEAGIDRDHVNRLGWTALHEAVILGDGGPAHVATVRALVRGGVDIAVPDGDGVTALAHAEERGFAAVVRILRAANARGEPAP
jgi:ankyrin repeat protein